MRSHVVRPKPAFPAWVRAGVKAQPRLLNAHSSGTGARGSHSQLGWSPRLAQLGLTINCTKSRKGEITMTRTWLKFLFALSSFIFCNTELVICFSQVFFLYYSKITTFTIELENLENMRKNLRTHQSEFRQEDSAHESLIGTLPSGASFPLRPSRDPPSTACNSRAALGQRKRSLSHERPAPSRG